jgi:hypothetical protein
MSDENENEGASEPAKKKIKAKKPIKLRLNYRTVVTVKSEAALKAWLERYPDAKIID